MAATPSQRNWKGIAIALLVIGAVIGLVALAVVIITPPDPGPRIKGRRVASEDVLHEDRLKPRNLNGTWISGERRGAKGLLSIRTSIFLSHVFHTFHFKRRSP